MNIGIVGPPGAGKSKLARKMTHCLPGDVRVVDNYVAKLRRDTGLALGPFANWSENYMVAGYRRALELKAREDYDHVVTVGTILDTMYYCGIVSQQEMAGTRDQQASSIAVASAMSGVGMWFRSDWDYDFAFCVCPPVKSGDWIDQYSENIPPLAQSLLIPNMYGYESANDFDAEFFTTLVAPTDEQPV